MSTRMGNIMEVAENRFVILNEVSQSISETQEKIRDLQEQLGEEVEKLGKLNGELVDINRKIFHNINYMNHLEMNIHETNMAWSDPEAYHARKEMEKSGQVLQDLEETEDQDPKDSEESEKQD